MSEILIKPLATEKAIRGIESNNVITFIVARKAKKEDIALEFERIFKVKPKSIRTLNFGGFKKAYIKLPKEMAAIDLATKIGII